MSNARLYLSFPLSRKNTITFCNIWAIFARKQGRTTNQRVRIKLWQNFVNSLKLLVLKFSSFAAIDHKGYFRKILTEFLSLTPFLGTAPSRVKKKERIKWRGRRMNWKLFRKIRHYLYNSREKEYGWNARR